MTSSGVWRTCDLSGLVDLQLNSQGGESPSFFNYGDLMKLKFIKGDSVKVCDESVKEALLADGWKIEGDEPKAKEVKEAKEPKAPKAKEAK